METIDILKYDGIDWLAMLLSVVAVWLLGNKNKVGFLVFMTANMIWIVLGFLVLESYGIVAGNVFFLISNSRGYVNWKRVS